MVLLHAWKSHICTSKKEVISKAPLLSIPFHKQILAKVDIKIFHWPNSQSKEVFPRAISHLQILNSPFVKTSNRPWFHCQMGINHWELLFQRFSSRSIILSKINAPTITWTTRRPPTSLVQDMHGNSSLEATRVLTHTTHHNKNACSFTYWKIHFICIHGPHIHHNQASS